MAVPPPYDPTGWSDTDPTTWPSPVPPSTLYQPGMVWTITAPGVVWGQTVDVGDLLFVVHRSRTFGEFTFGSGQFGSPPGQDWTADDVAWLAWYTSAPPEFQPPFPYSGCPFGPGWWIIIEAFYLDDPGRTFGADLFGDGVFGDAAGAVARWVDITAGYTEVGITRGNTDGAPVVDALELVATWYDPDHSKWDLAPPTAWHRPAVGDNIRVSFYDPAWHWYPRAVGEIEQIVDAHGAPPRFVAVQAFGHVIDLDRTLIGHQRPAELASARFAALLADGGWNYGTGDLVYPFDAALHADAKPVDVTARNELDRTALSAGWTFDTDRYGLPRLRPWPLVAADPVAVVVDCVEHGDPGVVATVITYTSDTSQLLNIASTTNALEPPTVASSTDPVSVAIHGGHDNAHGWPATGLAWADQSTGDRLAATTMHRYSRILTHVDPILADTLVDAGWLPVLAGTDTGEPWTVVRVHPTRWELDAIVVGLEETITPDRIEATVHTTTTTPTH